MKGQVWIETTLYTLIGLAIIGMVLTYALPKITSYQEKIVIEQSITSMVQFDEVVTNLLNSGAGNKRSFDISFKTGTLVIDPVQDNINFDIKELSKAYSEVGLPIVRGNILIKTIEDSKKYSTLLRLNYTNVTDIATEDGQIISLPPVSTGYRLWLTHNGTVNNKNQIVVELGK